jgi:putative ABC transport system permease protein
VRATSRHQEIAVRVAFGAGRGRVIWQLLTESVLLAVIGAVLGILLAVWGLEFIAAAIPQESSLPYWIEFRIDLPVLLFTLTVALLTGIAFGLAPALQVSRTDLNRVLREGGRGAVGGIGYNRLRNVLVIAEIALSLILLVGASLFVRSFLKLLHASGGFETTHILTMRITLPGEAYKKEKQVVHRIDDIVLRLEGLPGVEAVGASNTIPLSGGGSRRSIFVEGQTFTPGQEPTIFYTGVTPHFFRALGVPVIAGRGFAERERLEKSYVALVNEKLAKRFWPDGSAVGRRFRLKNEEGEHWITVAGIVPNIKNDDIDKEIPASAYVPFPNLPSTYTGLLVRTRLDPAQATSMVRAEIHASDPNLPIFQVATMERARQEAFWEYRLFGSLFALFSSIALLLAALGVYGVLAFAIQQRRREIGVRVALGAQQAGVFHLFLKQGLRLALGGVLIGLLGAFGASRLIASLLYEVSATDPATFVGIALLLVVVALVASYLPARRAMAVDPLEVLRSE